MRRLFIAIVLTLSFLALRSQTQVKYLTADEVETWPKEKISVPTDYNRISSYVYLLNKQKVLDIFTGVTYTKEELEELGIKKNDKPDFLQVSIKLKHPDIANGADINIPLFIYDNRIKNTTQSFSGIEGTLLNDIREQSLDKNVTGKIEINALVSNSSTKFWQGVAKIAADFGQSAVSLTLGNASAALDLKAKLSNYLNDGISALNNLSGGNKQQNYTFYITLVDREKSQTFDEIVTNVRLYQMHWSTNPVSKSSYFGFVQNKKLVPSDFKLFVKNTDLPYILVVESRTRPKIEVGSPAFSDAYRASIASEYELYPENDGKMLRSYYKNFTIAYQAYNYFNTYKGTLIAEKPDNNSLINALEYYYRFKIAMRNQESEFSTTKMNTDVQNRFNSVKARYERLDRILYDLFIGQEQIVQVQKVMQILASIINPLNTDASNKDLIYAEIIKLNDYEVINGTQLSNESYIAARGLRDKYENRLVVLIKAQMPSDDLKATYLQKVQKDYPVCVQCQKLAQDQDEVDRVIKKDQLVKQYKALKKAEYDNFNACRKAIETLFPAVKDTIDRLEALDKKVCSESFKMLQEGIERWKELINKSTEKAEVEDLNRWIKGLPEARRAIQDGLNDLIQRRILTSANNCIPGNNPLL